MNDIIQKWIQRKTTLQEQLDSVANKAIMDDEDAIKYDIAAKQLNLITEIINDLQQHKHYV